MKKKKNIIIIGGGLSGLYSAYLLQEKFNLVILEGREVLGGRICTKEGHDLGPSWVWSHQKNILTLIDTLKLELFEQYDKGEALYDAPQGVERFSPPAVTPSKRLKGGMISVIDTLVEKLFGVDIHTNEEVLGISYEEGRLTVKTVKHLYEADYVLSTLPPRVACENLFYQPDLDTSIKKKMLDIPTWMGHSVKCVIEFSEAFWKKEGLSGFVYSPIGPLGEIYDASTLEKPALFGFVNSHALIVNLEKDIRIQLKRVFGVDDKKIQNIYIMDWREEKFTATPHDKQVISTYPAYGLEVTHFNRRLFFLGTETSYDNGGYLEGAVVRAKRVAQELLSFPFE